MASFGTKLIFKWHFYFFRDFSSLEVSVYEAIGNVYINEDKMEEKNL